MSIYTYVNAHTLGGLQAELYRERSSVSDIAITNIVWCMAYTRGSEGGSYIAQ